MKLINGSDGGKIFRENGKLWTTSRHVAEDFDKRHDNVVRDIKSLDCSEEFRALNFEESNYLDSAGKKTIPMYKMTRDGFVFLVMGYTGEKAARVKEDYISIFNDMERQINKTPEQLTGTIVQIGNAIEMLGNIANELKVKDEFLEDYCHKNEKKSDLALTTAMTAINAVKKDCHQQKQWIFIEVCGQKWVVFVLCVINIKMNFKSIISKDQNGILKLIHGRFV